MAKSSAVNLDITPNADGYSIAGGTTSRTLTLTAGNVTLSAGGSNTYTMPSATDTLVGRASTDTLTNKSIDGSTNTITNIYLLKRQDNTSNSTPTYLKIQTGWGFILGSGSSGVMTKAVTFPTSFTNAPVIYMTYLNTKSGSDPASITEFTSGAEDVTVSSTSISTSGFTARMYKPSAFTNTSRFGYSWVAIGE